MRESSSLIERELRGEFPIATAGGNGHYLRPAPTEGWMSTGQVARALCTTTYTLHGYGCDGLLNDAIERRSGSARPGAKGQGVGMWWRAADVQRVAAIKRRCRLRLAEALRVYVAIKKDGPL